MGSSSPTCRTSSGKPPRTACWIRVNDVLAHVRVIEVMARVTWVLWSVLDARIVGQGGPEIEILLVEVGKGFT